MLASAIGVTKWRVSRVWAAIRHEPSAGGLGAGYGRIRPIPGLNQPHARIAGALLMDTIEEAQRNPIAACLVESEALPALHCLASLTPIDASMRQCCPTYVELLWRWGDWVGVGDWVQSHLVLRLRRLHLSGHSRSGVSSVSSVQIGIATPRYAGTHHRHHC